MVIYQILWQLAKKMCASLHNFAKKKKKSLMGVVSVAEVVIQWNIFASK